MLAMHGCLVQKIRLGEARDLRLFIVIFPRHPIHFCTANNSCKFFVAMFSAVMRALSIPLSALLVVVLLPMFLSEKLVEGVSLLGDFFVSTRPSDFSKSVEFLRSTGTTQELLRTKFPNSIAVRS